MKKINFNSKIKLPKLKINNSFLKTFLISFVTVIVALGIIISLVWHYRTKIFDLFATNYIKGQQINTIADNQDIFNQNKESVESISGALPLMGQENSIVDTVRKVNPAVVSIVATKEVPKYDVSYDQTNPFGDFFGNQFPGFFFEAPNYTQNGTEEKEIGSGSGFLISSDGLIVTNRHVVADTTAKYTVSLNNGKKYTAQVLDRDAVLDVAILKIIGTGLPYLELANSDKIEVGQSVIAIGNALGEFKNTVSVGIVSGLSRSLIAGDGMGNSERLDKVIQTDAAINPGNSGGPLLDLTGKVVGINVALAQGSENIGFALPINSVKSAIDSVKKTGKITRPYVGVRYIPITKELKEKNNLSVDYGVLVAKGQTVNDLAVIPGSPADKAGIVENDIILEINGQKINQDNDFASIIRGKNIGQTISLKILSKGSYKTVYLTLEKAPE